MGTAKPVDNPTALFAPLAIPFKQMQLRNPIAS